jgi:hypothetical protein
VSGKASSASDSSSAAPNSGARGRDADRRNQRDNGPRATPAKPAFVPTKGTVAPNGMRFK